MERKAVVKLCRELGCCDACCVRYLGLRNPASYDNPAEYVDKLLAEEDASVEDSTKDNVREISTDTVQQAEEQLVEEEQSTPAKRPKPSEDVCVCCLGLLQPRTWEHMIHMAQTQLKQKGYSCETFACALSSPLATALRERLVLLAIKQHDPHYTLSVTPLKEAWKWCFCRRLSERVCMRLESGAVAPLLLTFNMEYTSDKEEISALRTLSPSVGKTKAADLQNSRRVVEEMTARLRRLPDDGETLLKRPVCGATCRDVLTEHAPVYLGGRYIKLSRELPQSPWLLNGVRMMESSVQEIIFEPIAKLYNISSEDVDRRMKMISAGREDVDVRCLGLGRPFAVEILDPALTASPRQLQQLCDDISRSPHVKVKQLTHVTKQQLGELKKGEESKFKTYEALCIKLRHTDEDAGGEVRVTAGDVRRVAQLTSAGGGLIHQKTPLRVLHRRPLHTRARRLLHVQMYPIPGEPRLFAVRVQTEAGTYVKEWCHGEAGRTRPSLARALPADILALDVTHVHLPWPPHNTTDTTTADTTTADTTTTDTTTADTTTTDTTTADTTTTDTTTTDTTTTDTTTADNVL